MTSLAGRALLLLVVAIMVVYAASLVRDTARTALVHATASLDTVPAIQPFR